MLERNSFQETFRGYLRLEKAPWLVSLGLGTTTYTPNVLWSVKRIGNRPSIDIMADRDRRFLVDQFE